MTENQDIPVTMSDFTSIKDCLIRKRGITQTATNILDIEVKDSLISDKRMNFSLRREINFNLNFF